MADESDVIERARTALAAEHCLPEHVWAEIVIRLVTELEFARADVATWKGATKLLRAELGIT